MDNNASQQNQPTQNNSNVDDTTLLMPRVGDETLVNQEVTPLPDEIAEISVEQPQTGFVGKIKEAIKKGAELTAEGVKTMYNRAKEIGAVRFAFEMTPIGAHISNELEKSITEEANLIEDPAERQVKLKQLRTERGGVINMLKFGFGENRSADTWKASLQTGIVLGSLFSGNILYLMGATAATKIGKEFILEIKNNGGSDVKALTTMALSGSTVGLVTSFLPVPVRMLANGFVAATASELIFQFDAEINSFFGVNDENNDARTRAFKRAEVFRYAMAFGRASGSATLDFSQNIGLQTYIQDWFEQTSYDDILKEGVGAVSNFLDGDTSAEIEISEQAYSVDQVVFPNIFQGGMVSSGIEQGNLNIVDLDSLREATSNSNVELEPITLPDGTEVIPDWDGDDLDYISANGQVSYNVSGIDPNGNLILDPPIFTTDSDLIGSGFLQTGQSAFRTPEGEPQFLNINGEAQYVYTSEGEEMFVDLVNGDSIGVRIIDPEQFPGFDTNTFGEGTYIADSNNYVYQDGQLIGRINTQEGNFIPQNPNTELTQTADTTQGLSTTIENGFDFNGDGTIDAPEGTAVNYGGYIYGLEQDDTGFYIETNEGNIYINIEENQNDRFTLELVEPQAELVSTFDSSTELQSTIESGTPVLIQPADFGEIDLAVLNNVTADGGLILIDIPDGESVSLDLADFETVTIDGNQYLALPANVSSSDLSSIGASSCNIITIPQSSVGQLNIVVSDLNGLQINLANSGEFIEGELVETSNSIGILRDGLQGSGGDSPIRQLADFYRNGNIDDATVREHLEMAREYYQNMPESEQESYRGYLTQTYGSLQTSRLLDLNTPEADAAFVDWFFTDDNGNTTTSLYRVNGYSNFVGQASATYTGWAGDNIYSQPPGAEFLLPVYEEVPGTSISGPSTGTATFTNTSGLAVVNGGQIVSVNGGAVTAIGQVHVLGGQNVGVPNVSSGIINGVHFAPILDADNNLRIIDNGIVLFAGDSQVIVNGEDIFISNIYTDEAIQVGEEEQRILASSTAGQEVATEQGQTPVEDEVGGLFGFLRFPVTSFGQGWLGLPIQGIFNPDAFAEGFENNNLPPAFGRILGDGLNLTALPLLIGVVGYLNRNKLSRIVNRDLSTPEDATPTNRLMNVIESSDELENPAQVQAILDRVKQNQKDLLNAKAGLEGIKNQILASIDNANDPNGFQLARLQEAYQYLVNNGVGDLYFEELVNREGITDDQREELNRLVGQYFDENANIGFVGENYNSLDEARVNLRQLTEGLKGVIVDQDIREGAIERIKFLRDNEPNSLEVLDGKNYGEVLEYLKYEFLLVGPDAGDRFEEALNKEKHLTAFESDLDTFVSDIDEDTAVANARKERIMAAVNARELNRKYRVIIENADPNLSMDGFEQLVSQKIELERRIGTAHRDISSIVNPANRGEGLPTELQALIEQAINESRRAGVAEFRQSQVPTNPDAVQNNETPKQFLSRIQNALQSGGSQAQFSPNDLQRFLGILQNRQRQQGGAALPQGTVQQGANSPFGAPPGTSNAVLQGGQA